MNRRETLRGLCRVLSPAAPLDDPAAREAVLGVVSAPSNWPAVALLAGSGLVTPALAGALRRKGLFERIPADARQYLQAMQELNRERNVLLREELHRVTGWLNDIDIRPVVLKGAINLIGEQYPGSDDRVVGDLDLLVPEERLEEAFEHIQREDYAVAPGYAPDFLRSHHHAPPVLHGGKPVTVELHRHLCREALRPLLPTPSYLENAIELEWRGRALRLPGPTDRVMHTFLHDQLQDRGYANRHLSLRSLLEFCGQTHAVAASVDWAQIGQRLGTVESNTPRKAWQAWLAAAEDWFGLELSRGAEVGAFARGRHRQVLWAMTSRPVNRFFYWKRRLFR